MGSDFDLSATALDHVAAIVAADPDGPNDFEEQVDVGLVARHAFT